MNLRGNGNVTGELALSLQDPTQTGDGADGRITLTEIIDVLRNGDLSDLVASPSLTGLGSLDLSVGLDPPIDFINLGALPSIDVAFNLGDLFETYPDELTFATAVRTANDSFTLSGDQSGDIPFGTRVVADLGGNIVETFVTAVSYDMGIDKTTVTVLDDELVSGITSVTISSPTVPVVDF